MAEKKYKEPEHTFLERMRAATSPEFDFVRITGEDVQRMLDLIDTYEPYHHAYYK